ncbi:helix-turn-helix transcriptional regulator [Paenibacillus lautus]|uniref:helix-turn-helix transcriptional regulator n=1 Tax=Paenibacillus lautus TaxID=1401 RepID=UPI003D28DE53
MYNTRDLVVRINWTFRKTTSSDWSDIRNNTAVHSFYWIHEGSGIFHTDQAYPVSQGMLFYMEPGLQMRMESAPEAPLTISMVLFECCSLHHCRSEWQLPQSVQRLDIPFTAHYLGERTIGLEHAFSEITRTWVPGNTESELESSALLLRLIAKLHQQNKPPIMEPAYEAYQRIKSDIEEHYADPLQIGALAKKHAISESYLRKLFMKHLHVSPKDYLTDIRMRHAERYLAYTSYSLRFIANVCGFHDEFHFSKVFHKYKGMAPSAFRKNSKHANQSTS